MTDIHEPKELRQIDLKLLQAKIINLPFGFVTCTINNPKFKFKVHPVRTNSVERLKILMKYALYKYLLQTKEIRYCDCGNLIMDKRKYVDMCDECSKG